jgi:membrane protease YdiL (CAAX protease family)
MRLLFNIKRHPFVTVLIGILGLAITVRGFWKGNAWQMSGYLVALVLSAITVELLTAKFENRLEKTTSHSPRKELIWIVSTQAIVIIFAVIRFQLVSNWQSAPLLAKLPFYVVNALFVFPIVLLAAFRKWGYSFGELGFRFRYFWVGLPVILIFALATFIVIPERDNYAANYRDLGLLQMFFISFIIAATPEEFVRYLAQTRFGKLFANNAAGWLVASLIWASLHLPSFYANNSRGFVSAIWAVIGILPLGLLWSFINHRTKSIIPAVLVHGTNLWALHDF